LYIIFTVIFKLFVDFSGNSGSIIL